VNSCPHDARKPNPRQLVGKKGAEAVPIDFLDFSICFQLFKFCLPFTDPARMCHPRQLLPGKARQGRGFTARAVPRKVAA
jgi:hypothetical protein